MAKNLKAADLIGKTVSIKGSDAKYVIKSVEGDKLMTDFYRAKDAQPMPCPLPWATLEAKMKEGVYCIEDAVQGSSTSEAAKPSAKVQGSSSTDEVEEVEEIVVEGPKAAPRAETIDMKPKKKSDKPKAAKTEKKQEAKGGKYTFKTYTREKNGHTKTLGRIDGLQEGDEWLEREVAEKLHASPMYDRNEDGTKTWWLSFGKRYVDAGRKVCEAMNAGKTIDEMQAIVDAQTDENHRLAEERKAKREERKANENANENEKPAGYSDKDVAEMLKKIMAGGDIPEDIKAAMAA